MSADEEFTRHLRERIDAVGPAITVDTSGVIRGARRRRTVVRSGAATAAVTAVALVGWLAAAQPFTTATGYAPAVEPEPVATQDVPTPTPSATTDAADAGWPDAAYWHTTVEVRQGADVEVNETWYGHTAPGLMVSDGDLASASGMGPASWTDLPINGVDTIITWDALYALPTDPAVLEQLLRGAVQPDRRAGTDDEKVFGMIQDLMNNSPASPALRRALWSVASGLPGVVVTPGATDTKGRPATMLANPTATFWPEALYVDPDDGRLLQVDTADAVVVYLDAGPATAPPVEPTLEGSGCTSWATC